MDDHAKISIYIVYDGSRYVYMYTSPMPEDAPVMSMTFPATFSQNRGLMIERRNLRNRYGGRKKSSKVRPMGGSTMFSSVLMISISCTEIE